MLPLTSSASTTAMPKLLSTPRVTALIGTAVPLRLAWNCSAVRSASGRPSLASTVTTACACEDSSVVKLATSTVSVSSCASPATGESNSVAKARSGHIR